MTVAREPEAMPTVRSLRLEKLEAEIRELHERMARLEYALREALGLEL